MLLTTRQDTHGKKMSEDRLASPYRDQLDQYVREARARGHGDSDRDRERQFIGQARTWTQVGSGPNSWRSVPSPSRGVSGGKVRYLGQAKGAGQKREAGDNMAAHPLHGACLFCLRTAPALRMGSLPSILNPRPS